MNWKELNIYCKKQIFQLFLPVIEVGNRIEYRARREIKEDILNQSSGKGGHHQGATRVQAQRGGGKSTQSNLSSIGRALCSS